MGSAGTISTGRKSRALDPASLKRHMITDVDVGTMTAFCRKCDKRVDVWRKAEGAYLCVAARNTQHNHLVARYGITKAQYDAMYEAQQGRCAICGEWKPVLHVDHCHDSGSVRQLLCGSCNRMIGLAHDDVGILQSAIDYLKDHQ